MDVNICLAAGTILSENRPVCQTKYDGRPQETFWVTIIKAIPAPVFGYSCKRFACLGKTAHDIGPCQQPYLEARLNTGGSASV
jgi:hypothetical protein